MILSTTRQSVEESGIAASVLKKNGLYYSEEKEDGDVLKIFLNFMVKVWKKQKQQEIVKAGFNLNDHPNQSKWREIERVRRISVGWVGAHKLCFGGEYKTG